MKVTLIAGEIGYLDYSNENGLKDPRLSAKATKRGFERLDRPE